LPNNENNRTNKNQNVQGISGFGRFFVVMWIKKVKIGFSETLMLTLALGSVLLFAVWQLASNPLTPEAEALQEEVEFLGSELAEVTDRLQRVRAREHVLEREVSVLRRANQLLQENESGRQAELNRLQSELDFYRRLARTGGVQTGLDVYRAELIPTESAKVFQFVLTLTQNIRRASIVSGRARIDVEGIANDRPVTLEWPEISGEETSGSAFRFKYFQQLEGYLILPDGFSPTRLVVTLEAEDQRAPVERGYVWKDMLIDAAD
jgi:hypothetical protein